MVDFVEERLELGINYGAVGGFRFNTTVIETGSGGQQRNINWWLPLGRWQLGDRSLLESELAQEVTYLKEFHEARKGSKQGFRFRDWSDYQAKDQIVAIADGVTTTYQLKKTYHAGTATCHRPITKPVAGTVTIYLDGALQSTGWSLEYTMGQIIFASPPATGIVIQASYQFDVPVWFETDSIGWRLEGYSEGEAIYKLESVFVEEGRIPIDNWQLEQLETSLDNTLDLGIYYDTIETYNYQTSKEKLVSGFVRRDSNYEQPIVKLNLGDRNLSSAEVEELLGFFWCAKGQARTFTLRHQGKNYLGRFGQDSFSLKFEGYDLLTEEKIFYLSGLTFESTFALEGILDFIDNETYVITVIDSSGSMNSSIPAITSALDNLKTLLQNNIYQTETQTDKYFKIIYDGSEKWVNFLNADYRNDSNEPNKIIFLCWINEANSVYHNSTNTNEPTANFDNDLNNFVNSIYPQRQKFKAIIYSVIFDSQDFQAFQNHLTKAYLGQSPYTTVLKDYNVEARLNVPENTTADDYYADFLGTKIVGEIPT